MLVAANGDIVDSPAINGGRGLKQDSRLERLESRLDSPAINGGRGLKRVWAILDRKTWRDSPAINGGRGLKHFGLHGFSLG